MGEDGGRGEGRGVMWVGRGMDEVLYSTRRNLQGARLMRMYGVRKISWGWT